jgi:hypothetical protein
VPTRQRPLLGLHTGEQLMQMRATAQTACMSEALSLFPSQFGCVYNTSGCFSRFFDPDKAYVANLTARFNQIFTLLTTSYEQLRYRNRFITDVLPLVVSSAICVTEGDYRGTVGLHVDVERRYLQVRAALLPIASNKSIPTQDVFYRNKIISMPVSDGCGESPLGKTIVVPLITQHHTHEVVSSTTDVSICQRVSGNTMVDVSSEQLVVNQHRVATKPVLEVVENVSTACVSFTPIVSSPPSQLNVGKTLTHMYRLYTNKWVPAIAPRQPYVPPVDTRTNLGGETVEHIGNCENTACKDTRDLEIHDKTLLLSAQRDQLRVVRRLRRKGSRRPALRANLYGHALVKEQLAEGDPLTIEPVSYDTMRPLYFNMNPVYNTVALRGLCTQCCSLWQLFVSKYTNFMDHMRYTFDLHCLVILYSAMNGKLSPRSQQLIFPCVPRLAETLPWGQHLLHFGYDPDMVEGALEFFDARLHELDDAH